MKSLIYGAETINTTDGIADAVIAYAAALSRAHTTDLVDIPVTRDGVRAGVRLLVGDGVPVAVVSPVEEADAVTDDEAERDLRRLLDALPSTGPELYGSATIDDADDPRQSGIADWDWGL